MLFHIKFTGLFVKVFQNMSITGLTPNNVNPGKARARRTKNGNQRYQSDHTLTCQTFMWPLSNMENLTVIIYLASMHICRAHFSQFSLLC